MKVGKSLKCMSFILSIYCGQFSFHDVQFKINDVPSLLKIDFISIFFFVQYNPIFYSSPTGYDSGSLYQKAVTDI